MDSEIVRVKSKVSWDNNDFTSAALKPKWNNEVIGSVEKKERSGVKVRRHMETGVSSAFLESCCLFRWLVKKFAAGTLTCTGVWKCSQWRFVCSMWLQMWLLCGEACGTKGEMRQCAFWNNEVKKTGSAVWLMSNKAFTGTALHAVVTNLRLVTAPSVTSHWANFQIGLCELIFSKVEKAKHWTLDPWPLKIPMKWDYNNCTYIVCTDIFLFPQTRFAHFKHTILNLVLFFFLVL